MNDSEISAWFDNELMLAERAEVEQRLEQSSEAREELVEVKAVSNWISELPPAVLPRDFATRVVGSITETTAATEPVSSTVPMRWTQGFGVLISVAAVLVVAVSLMNGPSAMNESFDSSVASANAESESPARRDGLSRLQAEEEAGASYSLHPGSRNKGVAKRDQTDRAEKQLPTATSQARNATPGEFTFDVDLNRVVIGQHVDARIESGGQIAVVRLTVLDRVEGLENLQVLLTGTRIAKDAAEVRDRQSGDAAATAKPAEAKPSQGDYLVAVYVEASEQQLSSVFDKIRNDSRFQSMRVDEPIAAEQLALATNEQLRKNGRIISPKPNAAVPAAPPRPTRLKSEPEKSRESDTPRGPKNDPEKRKLAGKSGDAKKNRNGKSPATTDERGMQEELARVSRQLKITLPREMLVGKSQPAAPAADAPADDVADKHAESRPAKPAKEKAKVAKSRALSRPLQVIFVLDVAPEHGEN